MSGSTADREISLVGAADGGRLKVSGSSAVGAGFDVVAGGDYAINGTSVLTIDGAAKVQSAVGGTGLAHSSGVLSVDLNEVGAASVNVANDSIVILDADDSSATKKESIADLMTAAAGTGLAASSGQLVLDASELSDAAVASGDKFVFHDATDDSTKKESIDDIATLFAGTGLAAASAVLSVDLNELGAAAVAVASDSIAIIDATDNSTKKESIADLVTAMAGSGLSDSSGVLNVDLSELSAATVNVAADSIMIIDADDSNASKKESIVDLVSGISGNGLTATNGVMAITPVVQRVAKAQLHGAEAGALKVIEISGSGGEGPISAAGVMVFHNGQLLDSSDATNDDGGVALGLSSKFYFTASSTLYSELEADDVLTFHFLKK